jgi:predicted metal-dependent phosphoesterase TrpH
MPQTTLRLDPHVHSEASYDARDPPELLLEQAADIGLDGIIVTDHDQISASLRTAELASTYGLVGIPGVEVSTAHGHLLALGVEKRPDPGRPLSETVERVRELGGAAVIPHPFQRTRHGARGKHIVAAEPDGAETYNAWLFTGYQNRRARAFARRHGYSPLAGSDAHSVASLGRAYTELTVQKPHGSVSAEAVVEAICGGATDIKGRRVPYHKSAGHYAKGAGRKGVWAARSVGMTALSLL